MLFTEKVLLTEEEYKVIKRYEKRRPLEERDMAYVGELEERGLVRRRHAIRKHLDTTEIPLVTVTFKGLIARWRYDVNNS